MTEMRSPLTVAGLFSGSGGIELGLRRAGHHINVLCEIDPYAVTVLEARFPSVPVRRDVRDLETLGGADLLAAGFPCQDLSQVGPRNGIRGHKSGLIEHVFRLLRAQPVEWVLLENVSFLLSLHRGAGMRWILEQLDALGYRWAYRVIDSHAFGVPQRRKRVYVLASRTADPRPALLSTDKRPPKPRFDVNQISHGFYWTEGNRGIGWAVDAIPTLKGGSGLAIPSQPAVIRASGKIIVPDIRDGERLQGFPSGWTRPVEKAGARAGIRWRLVGNAVTVDVAEWIGERLASSLPTYREQEDRDVPLNAEPLRMPSAAWSLEAGKWVEARVGPWPVARSSSLEKFLKCEGKPLSYRAAKGFYDRLVQSNLNKPPPLVSALKRHLDTRQNTDR